MRIQKIACRCRIAIDCINPARSKRLKTFFDIGINRKFLVIARFLTAQVIPLSTSLQRYTMNGIAFCILPGNPDHTKIGIRRGQPKLISLCEKQIIGQTADNFCLTIFYQGKGFFLRRYRQHRKFQTAELFKMMQQIRNDSLKTIIIIPVGKRKRIAQQSHTHRSAAGNELSLIRIEYRPRIHLIIHILLRKLRKKIWIHDSNLPHCKIKFVHEPPAAQWHGKVHFLRSKLCNRPIASCTPGIAHRCRIDLPRVQRTQKRPLIRECPQAVLQLIFPRPVIKLLRIHGILPYPDDRILQRF